MMIAEAVKRLKLGEPLQRQNLTVIPVLDEEPAAPSYILMSDALKQGLLTIEEVDASGRVNTIKATNHAEMPVLLPDSAELVGAKQNRVLNISILLPANTTLPIPVTCVEAGRWSYQRDAFRRVSAASRPRTHERAVDEDEPAPERRFAPSSYMLHMEARMHKAKQVQAARRIRGVPMADQVAIWDDVRQLAMRTESESPTEALHDVYKRHLPRLDYYLDGMEPSEKQVGAIFAINGHIVGLELFDSPETFHKMFPQLLISYAIEAAFIEGEQASTPIFEEAKQFFEAVASAPAELFEAIGQGTEVHLNSEMLVGTALMDGQRLIHLYAFRK